MWRRSILTAGIVVMLMTTVALLQERRGPRRDGLGGPGPLPNSTAELVGAGEVQRELGFTEAQQKLVDQWLADAQDQFRASFGNFNFQELRELTDEDREKRFTEMRARAEEAVRKSDEQLAKILDAKQIERLNQLRLQREGLAAFGRPEVAKQLRLTDEQQEKIRELRTDPSAFFGPPEQRQQVQDEVLATLTDDQRAKWKELIGKEIRFPESRGPFGGFGPPGGGPGGPMSRERKIVAQFDKDGDGRLNADERKVARELLKNDRGRGGRGPGFGPPGGFGGGGPGGRPGGRGGEPGQPGPRVSPDNVTPIADALLYDPSVLRTLFFEFESDDWEAELADFHGTDVEVPATLTVDGKKYPNVGVHFRGMSSYMMVPAGSKRSFNVAIDFADAKQRLYGYKTLNLLNAHEDPSFLSTPLYSHIARQYIAAPKANFVKVVINGESWGVYVNAQQFNKEFTDENFKSTKGARWKVSGSPGGDGGLRYLGENLDEYKRRFEIKSGDNEKDWKALATLCRVLNETPPGRLDAALKPMLDIDGVLWFLALDVALINNDGYWTRASDYSIYRDPKGVFHIVPHDMNEAFHGAMMFGPGGGSLGGPGGFGPPGAFGPPGSGFGGPGRGEDRDRGPGDDAARRDESQRGRDDRKAPDDRRPRDGQRPNDDRPREGSDRRGGPEGRRGGDGPRGPGAGPRGGGIELDPLVGLDDTRKPLRSRLLAVPSLRAKYLDHVRTIAEQSLDWKKLGPVVEQYRELIEKEVEADTRKLTSFAAFQQAIGASSSPTPEGRRPQLSVKSFVEQRRNYLLNHAEIKQAASAPEK